MNLTDYLLAIPAHELGAYAVSYSSPSQLLFTGGKSGEIGRQLAHLYSTACLRVNVT